MGTNTFSCEAKNVGAMIFLWRLWTLPGTSEIHHQACDCKRGDAWERKVISTMGTDQRLPRQHLRHFEHVSRFGKSCTRKREECNAASWGRPPSSGPPVRVVQIDGRNEQSHLQK